MAETAKRAIAATAGKATAIKPAHSFTILEQALSTAIGARIRIQTANTNSQSLEGNLFTACPQTSLLAISTGALASPAYHILPISVLTAFTVVSLPSNIHQSSAIGPVNTAALLARANTALARAKERAAKINKAVGREVQDVFDALDKQFGARWKGKDIIVMERVVVKGPGYKGDDCKVITKDGEGLLNRVKKVIDNEKKRALQRDSGKGVKPAIPNIIPAIPAPQGPRKGG